MTPEEAQPIVDNFNATVPVGARVIVDGEACHTTGEAKYEGAPVEAPLIACSLLKDGRTEHFRVHLDTVVPALEYIISSNPEEWNNTDDYASRADAVAAAAADLDLVPGDTFYSGIKVSIAHMLTVTTDDADILLGRLDESIYNEVGDLDALEHLAGQPGTITDELAAAFTVVLHDWLDTHRLWPHVFGVAYVESHVVPDEM